MTNWEQLEAAGLTKPGTPFMQLSPEDRAAIDALTQAEVDCLIAVGNKLGPGFLERNVFGHPIFF